jgi:hypothetical protein
MYSSHLLGLEEYGVTAGKRLGKFRRRWYRLGMYVVVCTHSLVLTCLNDRESIATPPIDEPVLQHHTTHAEVRPDTPVDGEVSSEEDMSDNSDDADDMDDRIGIDAEDDDDGDDNDDDEEDVNDNDSDDIDFY